MNTIQARELRIGNFILGASNSIEDFKEFQVYTETFSDIESTYGVFKPIPLSEEWLSKLGFSYVSNKAGQLYYSNNGWSVLFAYGKWHWSPSPSITNGIDLKYVHQLQNLYFALTGTELTLTDK